MEALLSLDPLILAIITGELLLTVYLFSLVLFSRSEIQDIKDKYISLIEYLGDGDSRDLLQNCVDVIRELEFDSRIKEKDIDELFEILTSCIQKFAILRYNAFSNVGSDLSFSIALLDNDDNGIVISSLYGRESSTTYAKPIIRGRSEYILTGEEKHAISQAKKKHIGKSYYGVKKNM